ncbi:MAG: hypothetical protein US86_C0001G0209 [Candidatus Daviesbacteria bacterium GW2011_GWA2_38_24]|uniref:Gcp-like domain-containing protein n=1 Tax=Candidatus Daviesbacteria bacterium GW2011_GWA2_38_24 TaxID=1618422 RepID=A0A0G0JKA6_9BACT|nr:MAG: hypothetical protein US86_C0001G0209 [Candidatus Daviesbacteria bacterium GW2011_GWA2_38_24]KKQ79643.1 MAG: hypothetical protein UT01_C0032G0012 [Candidatus Daviesbacteria bacterium GW2011_GWA1_38_7]OGE23004.1 MAG: tRNA (adenosine(37)-N6)-threonylcarbamoyltransferase complex dimerization subunit type 1 TsaB [Candidatus Daviesbacteria bacterium RIFCSPHIGHO2_01_FULL_38_8]
MRLYIDTSDAEKVEVVLKKDSQEIDTKVAKNRYGSQVLLYLITDLLKMNTLEFRDLKEIEVNTGPGSFTGLRVGVSVANALGLALNILVNGKKQEVNLRYT